MLYLFGIIVIFLFVSLIKDNQRDGDKPEPDDPPSIFAGAVSIAFICASTYFAMLNVDSGQALINRMPTSISFSVSWAVPLLNVPFSSANELLAATPRQAGPPFLAEVITSAAAIIFIIAVGCLYLLVGMLVVAIITRRASATDLLLRISVLVINTVTIAGIMKVIPSIDMGALSPLFNPFALMGALAFWCLIVALITVVIGGEFKKGNDQDSNDDERFAERGYN